MGKALSSAHNAMAKVERAVGYFPIPMNVNIAREVALRNVELAMDQAMPRILCALNFTKT